MKHNWLLFLLGMLAMALWILAIVFALIGLSPCAVGTCIVANLTIWIGIQECQR